MHQTRRQFLTAVGISAAALAGRSFGAAAPKKRRPNVVLIFTDDQGTLDANCYGSRDLYTPAMDRLAATGVRFTQAYAHTVCCPARAMLMTGRHPQRSGVNNWMQGNAKGPKGLNMDAAEVTLAEALKAAGYRTGLFGKWHLGAHENHNPVRQGFDVFFGHLGGFIENYKHYFMHGNGFHDLYEGLREVHKEGQYFPDLTTARALQFIEANQAPSTGSGQARPFFLYLAFNIPHYPEQADAAFDDRYKDLPMPRRSYAKMISTVDDRIGQVLAKLDKLGLREDTIVVFMSDNGHSAEDAAVRVDNHASGFPKGYHYGANGGGGNTGKWRGHKGTFYEGGLRVPAIISFPRGLPRGEVRDQAITAMDWYPTILDLCGVDVPKGVKLDGHSVLPLIRDAKAPTPYKVMHWQWANKWAVREGDWKLIGINRKRNDKINVLMTLGNLADAKPEEKNYAKQKPDIVRRLRALHEAWAREVTPAGKGG